MFRIIKDDGAIFYNTKWRIQGGILDYRKEIIKEFPVRQIIIWEKNGSINPNPTYFLPTYEVIYMIAKPNFKLKGNKYREFSDVWKIPREHNNSHPAPFPIEIPNRIISSTNAQIILDPFMGSGTTAIAAIQNKRIYIGIDISQEYIDMANQRIMKFRNNETLKLDDDCF